MKKQVVLVILTIVLVNCGLLQGGSPADINNSGEVNIVDLGVLIDA